MLDLTISAYNEFGMYHLTPILARKVLKNDLKAPKSRTLEKSTSSEDEP